ncbi:MAG: acyl-CoA thioesterase [Angustibacter sp.]
MSEAHAMPERAGNPHGPHPASPHPDGPHPDGPHPDGPHPDGLGAASAPGGSGLLRSLLEVLDLTPQGHDERGQDVFTGISQPQPLGRVFGGQVLGQTMVAAGRTCPGERVPHSMHAYFLRPGNPDASITFTVERLRDGRSFSARRVQAVQAGQPILSMIASFQEPSLGVEHQDEMPDVPGPQDLPSAAQVLAGIDHPVVRSWAQDRPIDLRHVQPPIYWAPHLDRTAHQAVWMRTTAPMPDEDLLHRAVLGYASDYTVLEPALRRHGLAWASAGLRAASLDHAMWWHRPARVDEWLLYVQSSPSASGARGLGAGRIFSRDGRLVASVMQEGMLRVPG